MNSSNFQERINERFDLLQSKKNLKERTQQQLTLSYNGGLFKVTPELLSMLVLFKDDGTVVLEDSFSNPILVTDIPDMLARCKQNYRSVTNEWYAEYGSIKTVRKPSQL